MKKKLTCQYCKLFNPQDNLCGVVILHEGEKINLSVNPKDECVFEQEFKAVNEETSNIERFKIDLQEIKMWVEDPETGEKCKNGIVKIEYPEIPEEQGDQWTGET